MSTRKFGQHTAIPTAESSYKEGFETGITWNAPWIPGGPSFYTERPYEGNKPDWVAFCKATEENNREWRRGWEDGVEAQPVTITHPDRYYNRLNPRPKSCGCGYCRLRATSVPVCSCLNDYPEHCRVHP